MIVEPDTQKTAQPNATLSIPEAAERSFNWRTCWYPVTFVQDLPDNRPYSFSLYDEPFVVFRNREGKLGCLGDRCPHRAARLSDGQIIDGNLECSYHGWQFGTDGECLHVPQLPSDAKIPAKACVPSLTVVECQGIIWVWPGKPETADASLIPIIAELNEPGFVYSDKISELPYDQSYFIENVLDPAHIHISHDGSQGDRKNAQPLEMETSDISERGFRGRFRETRNPNQPQANLDFIAPNLVQLKINIKPEKNWVFSMALYSLPLGQGRCRVLSRSCRNFVTFPVKLMPRWLIHLNQNIILEEDLQLVVGQQARIQQLQQNLNEVYLPLNTSDLLVIEYRKWLDRYGASLPYYQGYSTSKAASLPVPQPERLGHTHLCSSCDRAYQVSSRLKQILLGAAIALAAVAVVTDEAIQIVAASASVSAVALAGVAQRLKSQLEKTLIRH